MVLDVILWKGTFFSHLCIFFWLTCFFWVFNEWLGREHETNLLSMSGASLVQLGPHSLLKVLVEGWTPKIASKFIFFTLLEIVSFKHLLALKVFGSSSSC